MTADGGMTGPSHTVGRSQQGAPPVPGGRAEAWDGPPQGMGREAESLLRAQALTRGAVAALALLTGGGRAAAGSTAAPVGHLPHAGVDGRSRPARAPPHHRARAPSGTLTLPGCPCRGTTRLPSRAQADFATAHLSVDFSFFFSSYIRRRKIICQRKSWFCRRQYANKYQLATFNYC